MKLLKLTFLFLLLASGSGYALASAGTGRQAQFCEDGEAAQAHSLGLKIQDAVRARDLSAFFALVEGELQRGPRRRDVEGKAFDEVFPDAWREAMLAAAPDCSPVGGRGYMLGQGGVWYRPGGVFAVNGWIVQEKPLLGGWRFDSYLLPPRCFVYQSLSGDVFEDFAKQHSIADSRSDPAFADFELNPGRHFGGLVRSFDVSGTSLWRHVNNCIRDSDQLTVEGYTVLSNDGERYAMLSNVPRKLCQDLAPNLPGECLQSHLLHRFSLTDGSLGYYGVYGIYGLFKMEDGAKTVFPLKYFDSQNLAKNFLDDYNRTR